MAEVIGPCSTLPGAHHPLPKGTMCDEHPDRPAVARRQGETDSMGAELCDLCKECNDEWNKPVDTSGVCDWCSRHKPSLRPRRDMDEGMSGRLYDVCNDCIAKENAAARQELEDSGYYDNDNYDWD